TDDVLDVGMNRAVVLIAEAAARKAARGGGRGGPAPLKEFEHEGEKIALLKGRYGPYIKYKGKNITLKDKEKKPEDYTLEDVLPLLPAGKKNTKKKPTKKKKTSASS